MKPKKVIAERNLPMRSPLVATAVAWILIDRYHASGLVTGIVGTVFAIIWIAWIASFRDKRIELFQVE